VDIKPEDERESIMKWSFMPMAAVAAFMASTALAQQVVVQPQVRTVQPQVQMVQPQVQMVQPQVQMVQPQRSYRSYSVRPSQPQRADRRSPAHSGEATWRHADSKAAGHYTGGR
jgi:hypothetical protein